MNLTKVILKNFLSHRDSQLDLDNKSVVLVVGKNGVGKSSLVRDSVTWALFGVARNADRAGDQLITDWADHTQVELNFSIGKSVYSVIRGRNRDSKSYLSLFRDGEDVTCDTIAETQDLINRTLGVNYTTFSQSVCIEQGKLNSFSTLTPKEAKKVFYDILGLGKYEIYETAVKEIVRALNNDLITYQSRADTLEQQAVPLEGAGDKLKAIDSRLEKLEADKDVGENKLTYLQDLLLTQKEHHQKKVADAEHKKAVLETQIADIGRELKLLESPDTYACPTCNRVIGEVERRKSVEKLNDSLSTATKRLTVVLAELNTVSAFSFDPFDDDISNVRNKVKDIEKTIAQVKEKRGYISSMYENQTTLKKQVSELRQKEQKKKDDIIIYKYLLDAFGSNGIPSIIMSSALDELQATANDFLSSLSGGKFKLEFIMERELKGGGTADTLQVKVYDGFDDRPYHSFSGGEKARIDLAIRLGLSVLLSRRNNFQTETLVIDEALESLDDEGRSAVKSLLYKLAHRFKKIIAVTHTDLKDRAFDTIELTKENGVSKIREDSHVS